MSADHDPIAVEIHRRALQSITNEMGLTLVRTSASPVVTEAMDFSTCLLDPDGEQLALVAYMLKHSASSLIGTRTLISELREAGREPAPGDGWVVNDPYHGGAMHQGDVGVIMPQFHRGAHVGWGFANVHVLDIGGSSVSGFNPGARTVFDEGLRFPLLRMISGGRLDPEWERYIASNVRVPGPVINDVRSMIAANNVAERKLSDLLDRIGPETHREHCRRNHDLTERLLRRRIAAMPDGVYVSDDWSEYDGRDGDLLLHVHLTMEVRGDELHFAFSGDPQVDSYMNSATGGMCGAVMSAIMTTLSYGDLPFNAGIWRPVEIDLGEPGTIVNAVAPAPVSATHAETGLRAIKLVKDVLSQAVALSDDPALRARCSAQAQDGAGTIGVTGLNQHGTTSVVYYLDTAVGQGGPAQTTMDGQDAYGPTTMVGCGMADVELHEAADPVMFLWRRVLANSGGPGLYRGGQGIDQAYAIVHTDRMAGWAKTMCAEVPPRGFGGGLPGSASAVRPILDSNVGRLLDEGRQPTEAALEGLAAPIRSKQSPFEVARGDVVQFVPGGGGGLGDPLFRAADLVAADVRAGYVTAANAAGAYGVVVEGEGRLDADATADRRAEIRRARLGRPPACPAAPPVEPGIAVRLGRDDEGETWRCGSCSGGLGGLTENWRTVAVVNEQPIHERFAEWDMRVRVRKEDPLVVVREHYCPECAAALGTDVTLAGAPVVAAPRLARARATTLARQQVTG